MQPLQLDDYLPTLEETSPTLGGRPLTLSLDAIDEDPAQPRTEFDAEALGELAASIASRGVLQPVSVRRHPEVAGRWILNFGARRYRAAKLAGRSEIPAFEDSLADSYSQVIENEHREALRPMELALFVKGRLDGGQSQAEIARHLGKSRAYVNYVCGLIDPPDWLMALYRDGKCRGVKELYDLRRMHDEHPAEVLSLVSGDGVLSRGEVSRLREDLAASSAASVSTSERHSAAEKAERAPKHESEGRDGSASPKTSRGTKRALPTAGRLSLSLSAEADGCLVTVVLDQLPAAGDEVFVVDDAAGKRRSVKLNGLQGFRLRRARRLLTWSFRLLLEHRLSILRRPVLRLRAFRMRAMRGDQRTMEHHLAVGAGDELRDVGLSTLTDDDDAFERLAPAGTGRSFRVPSHSVLLVDALDICTVSLQQVNRMETQKEDEWIAQCTRRLRMQWRTLDLQSLEEVARELWGDERLRSHRPEQAATEWLRRGMLGV